MIYGRNSPFCLANGTFHINNDKNKPDFSDRGNNLDKNNWIRPQNTVFWDLDNRLIRSEKEENQSQYLKKKYVYIFKHHI